MASHLQTPERLGYSIQSSSNSADTTTELIVSRGRTQFHITAHHALLANTEFYRQYEQLNDRLHEQIRQYLECGSRSEPWIEPHDFFCEQLLPLFRRLSPDPEPSLQGLTLQDLVATPTYTLEIVAGGPVSEGGILVKGEEDGITYTPSYGISPGPTQGLPESCIGVAHIQASEVWIEPIIKEGRDLNIMRLTGGKVLLADGTMKYFKARSQLQTTLKRPELDFERELNILGHIKKAGLKGGEIRLPDLVGIVVSGDMMIGMLLELIPRSTQGDSVTEKGCWENQMLCKKWEEQVTRIIEVLHANNIVWGMVSPGNVLIDEALDAWVVGFGGGNNCAFVDDGLAETKEGDWQGVRRLFREWLPSRRVDVHDSVCVF